MPTYEYKCGRCGTFEQWQSIKDDPLAVCPKCGSRVERLISTGGGFILKGAGFYQNDYRKPEPKPDPPPCGTGSCPAEKPAEKPSGKKDAPPGPCCGGACGNEK